MELNQDPNEKDSELEESEQGAVKQWFQDNLRIIISVLIVILIAGGIYSYSRRTGAPAPEEVADNSISSEITSGEGGQVAQEKTGETNTTSQNAEQKVVSSTATSQETETSFIETAASGDSRTTLARTALASFLEKNPDSGLTAEHKIYIEDYLQKKVGYNGRIYVGTSVEFSKNLIQEAIARSKNLTENQLKNLHKYTVLVPSLS